ncbi:MAG: hypothetical protein Q9221_004929 [Calogaya cf. arnoldii]
MIAAMGLSFSQELVDGTLRPFKLDIAVPLVIILGEYSRSYHRLGARAASWSCMIPRIVSATPLYSGLFEKLALESQKSIVTGNSNSANIAKQLHWLPNLLHPIQNLHSYEFRVFRIGCKSKVLAYHYDSPSLSGAEDCIVEDQKVATLTELHAELRSGDQLQHGFLQRSRKFLTFLWDCTKDGVLVLSIGFFLATVALIVWAILIADGLAIIGILLLCFASSLNGLSSKWTCRALEKRPVPKEEAYRTNSSWPHIMSRWTPRWAKPFSLTMLEAHSILDAKLSLLDKIGCQILIVSPNGAITVIHCTEAVASLLYTTSWATMHFLVKNQKIRRLLNASTPIVLFGALILIASCTWTMQVAIGSVYVTLLLIWEAFFTFSKCPVDLNHFTVTEETPERCQNAHQNKIGLAESEQPPNFVRTLWYALCQTKDDKWDRASGILPSSSGWYSWLEEAMKNKSNPQWPAVAESIRLTGQEVMPTGEYPPVIISNQHIASRNTHRSDGGKAKPASNYLTLPPIARW